MTNYTGFPSWRKEGIVIKFAELQHSWCSNSKANRKYLLESDYCDRAIEFYVWENDTTYHDLESFKEYLRQKQEGKIVYLCPNCGSKLVLRRNSKDGSFFYGCSKYPECRYTRGS